MPPRIGPKSDFYGRVIPPGGSPCSGLISNPAGTIHEVTTNKPGTNGGLENATLIIRIGHGSSISQTDAYAQASDDTYMVPNAGLAGYYYFEVMGTVQITYAPAPSTVAFRYDVYLNSVLFASTTYTYATPGTGIIITPYFQVPIIGPIANGGKVSVYATGIAIGGNSQWSGMPSAGGTDSNNFAHMKFLGS